MTPEFKDQVLVGFGDVIDRIVCTTVGSTSVMRRGRDNDKPMNRYQWMKVYDDTREKYGRPLTLLAAEKLMEVVGESDYVFIVSNSFEMDGPPGAAAMARAVIVGMDAIPVILTNYEPDTKQERCMPATCIGAQLNPVYKREELSRRYTVLIHKWPNMSVSEAIEESKRILDEYNPKAIVTVEAVSHNKVFVRHGAMGGARKPGDPEEKVNRWNQLLDVANERGILTIATGDNGNECGFGTIEDICKEHHSSCAMCACPCGEGIVSAAKADIVIPGQSSNWAAYGIEACMAFILGNPEVMHDEYTENQILLGCALEGIPDGASTAVTPTTDGSSHKAGIYTVGQLRETVKMASKETVREPRRNIGVKGIGR